MEPGHPQTDSGGQPGPGSATPADPAVPLPTIAREWTRIGLTGFGGPPAHIALLRALVVGRRWLEPEDVEESIAACNLLPGPASTQLAMLLARRVAGPAGAAVAGAGFIIPAVAIILLLSWLFLGSAPPLWVRGAGAGAGAAVAAVAVHAAWGLLVPSWKRAAGSRRPRWLLYVTAGGVAAALIGPYLVLVLIACGMLELILAAPRPGAHAGSRLPALLPLPLLGVGAVAVGGLGAVAWVAFKVGALSYGGGFVIVPLMQHDAVHTYHWMSASRFLDAVALGQVTPGPVVATVSAVGYAAHGVGGGLLAAAVAFAPSVAFVVLGGGHFDRLRRSPRAQEFLAGAGPAAIGAILGSAIPLAAALSHAWQFAVLAAAGGALFALRRGVVLVLVAAGAIGVIVALAGGAVPH